MIALLRLGERKIVRALTIGWLMISVGACSKASTSNSVQASATPPFEHLATSGPGPPIYVAADYDKPGHHPTLTLEQIETIRRMLARVKPCQRPLLRYVLDDEVTLFFAVPPGQGAHVLGTRMDVYFPRSGIEVPMPQDGPAAEARAKQGVQWDIDHQPCPH